MSFYGDSGYVSQYGSSSSADGSGIVINNNIEFPKGGGCCCGGQYICCCGEDGCTLPEEPPIIVSPTDYNELDNIPIVNIMTSDGLPLILKNYPVGEYIVKGSYKFSEDGETYNAESGLNFYITLDEVTGNKVIIYESYENGILYKNTVEVTDTGVVTTKIPIDGSNSNSGSNDSGTCALDWSLIQW